MIVKKYGQSGLQPGHITIRLRGSAGQSLGAFAVQGLKLEVFGDSNDYVGKGLSGGTIVVRPAVNSPLKSNENTIIGNTVLYGATAGKLFAAGQAGERFAVRNSGAQVVIEGCGSNGCEYMTNGTVVILGSVGANFGAGMTGGMAYVYDADGLFDARVNPDSVVWQRVEVPHYEGVLKALVEEHFAETQSAFAESLLTNWSSELGKFWQVVPKEMLNKLEIPVTAAASAKASA
jgi:glutamate synthase (NADPH/NADH) large chain